MIPNSFDSIRAASAGLKIPISKLRKIKAAGCPGFRSGRVFPAEIVAWLKSHPAAPAQAGPPDDKETLALRKLGEQIREIQTRRELNEIELAKRRGEFASVSEICRGIENLAARIKSSLQFQLLDRLPAMAAGRSAAEIRVIGEAILREILGEWHSWASKQTQPNQLKNAEEQNHENER
jgi:hypothetical protein